MAALVTHEESFPDVPPPGPLAEETAPPQPSWGSYASEAVPDFLTDSLRAPSLSGRKPTLPAVQKPRRNVARTAAWCVIAALAAALIVLLAVGRTRIVALWPATAPVYAAFGMRTPVPGAGLEMQGVKTQLAPVDGKMTLIVTGRVVNVTGVPQNVPPLTITVRDTRDAPVKSWSLAPSRPSLLPGEGLSFQSAMASPPDNLGSALVTFASR